MMIRCPESYSLKILQIWNVQKLSCNTGYHCSQISDNNYVLIGCCAYGN